MTTMIAEMIETEPEKTLYEFAAGMLRWVKQHHDNPCLVSGLSLIYVKKSNIAPSVGSVYFVRRAHRWITERDDQINGR